MSVEFRSANDIRSDFSNAMSLMYRAEVPAYGDLISIVEQINKKTLNANHSADLHLNLEEDIDRISQERHGAIRLGTAKELAMMARVFSVMGMVPVGYYDLSVAGIPVHSTAFRPIKREDLAVNPFRVFTSLLRLELIEDEALRERAQIALDKRNIFSKKAIELTGQAETEGGLNDGDAKHFVSEVIETFRWHKDACIEHEVFLALKNSHALIADVVSFKGPHINHLTPRTLDIDSAQSAMIEHGLPAKEIVEGPPPRKCPILLRQTAFKALEESVRFPKTGGEWVEGEHTARFGEIEQRGAALTPKGRALYDEILMGVNSSDPNYNQNLQKAFEVFPDNWREMYDEELAYFKFSVGEKRKTSTIEKGASIGALLDAGILVLSPIIYEDFLPVSAAGIFQSNLGNDASEQSVAASSKQAFETALGQSTADEFEHYKQIQKTSLDACLQEISM
ncbi:MAG: VOC family protein [Nitratireductor sp.]